LQLFLVRPRNLAGPWKAGNLEALVYFKFNRYQAVLRFFEVPFIGKRLFSALGSGLYVSATPLNGNSPQPPQPR